MASRRIPCGGLPEAGAVLAGRHVPGALISASYSRMTTRSRSPALAPASSSAAPSLLTAHTAWARTTGDRVRRERTSGSTSRRVPGIARGDARVSEDPRQLHPLDGGSPEHLREARGRKLEELA